MLISISDVLSLVPVSRATLYRLMQNSDFPRSIKVGGRVFWDSKEIDSWVQVRKDVREQEA